MICDEVRGYIDNIKVRGSILGLTSIKMLLDELGNPQDKIKIVHVAGTNAKGSVSAYIESICQTSGYKVGLFASPAVFDYYEAYRINGQNISKEEYASVGSKVIEAVKQVNDKDIWPTSFEIETAIAYQYFYDKNVDIAIIETGMGGSLDATNVTKSTLVSVITPISIDHSAFLGDTIDAIAHAKAGIIKKDSVVTCALDQKEEAVNVIKKTAYDNNANVIIPDIKDIVHNEDGTFDYKDISGIRLKMYGKKQIENAVLAIETVRVLKEKYYYKQIDEELIKTGLFNMILPGRIEKIGTEPDIIIDGAHNPAAAQALRDYVKEEYKDRDVILLTGMFKDKDYTKVANIMSEVSNKVITVTPPTERGLDSEELQKVYRKIFSALKADDGTKRFIDNNSNEDMTVTLSYGYDYDKAFAMAKRLAGTNGAVIVFGSFSFLAQIKRK
ncbi:bifunctional folylpolyglutamate synthase/dihydrofolate synthase [Falcatimonas sp. MSJ-15]|uniref:bifunctional folylpolyglutamate synthase/dihydrofolate synthase n=1 Tax=Falcatimonas sp. MSJ-15 TaxID=2841515 RepID=UPI001C112F36|nr:folylpolyglutamate synthase/dihydrofolate synthase family protein [Falcatimonas sp. MSJ-15]MBU5468799.1 bifunctional folylpolyglutamate synthase/dihydrofolate synthase [Falcatimonas sp. MSJ-15]